MAKLPSDTLETIFNLLRQLSELVDLATGTEYLFFDRFGETEETISSLDELKGICLRNSLSLLSTINFTSSNRRKSTQPIK
jgi:hypothetical protein